MSRLVSAAAVGTGVWYLAWRFTTISGTGVFGGLFYAAECATFVALALSAAVVARAGRQADRPPTEPFGTLDVFITVCGEPLDMVERTLEAALAITYPHKTYLLNDGRLAGAAGWQDVARLAARYGVAHLARTDGTRGKAGNLNHALAQTSGEFVATIDADHVASPDLAHQTLGYFRDPRLAFVCTSQLFRTGNPDVLNNAEIFFYRFLQPAKDVDSSAFSCGNGTVYRRSALESIGGFSEWSLVEDLHTSYVLHAAGWRSLYHPHPVTVGSAPLTPSVFLGQRLRWATDSLRLLFWDSPLSKRGLSPMQRLHYFHTASFYVVASLQLLFLLGPPLYIFDRVAVSQELSIQSYLTNALPFFAATLAFFVVHASPGGALRTVQSTIFCAPVYVLATVLAIFKGRPTTSATEKGHQRWFSPLLVPQIVAFAFLLGAVGFAILDHRAGASLVALFWATFLAVLLAGPLTASSAKPLLQASIRTIARAGIVATALAAVAAHGLAPMLDGRRCSPPNRRDAGPALGSAQRLQMRHVVPPREGAYFGISHGGLQACKNAIVDWNAAYGHRLAIVDWFQQWRSGETAFRADWMRQVAGQGAIPMVTWEPWARPERALHDPEQPAVRLTRIVDGYYDGYIRSWARAAARFGGPILLRPMQEMNGYWYPWAVTTNDNTPAAFIAAWRHIHDIFEEEGAANVSWVWTVHSFPGLTYGPRNFQAFYPGAEYVDWTSLTTFNWGTAIVWGAWNGVDALIDATYEKLVAFGKPIMVSEIATAAEGGDPELWISRAMKRLEHGYPRIKAVVWFSHRYSGRIDFRLSGPTEDALRSALNTSEYWSELPRTAPVLGRQVSRDRGRTVAGRSAIDLRTRHG